ncbi:cupin domain-containing protein [Bradyrhizobium sp. 1.29L]
MDLLQSLATTTLGKGVVSKCSSENLLGGDPTFTSWNQVESKGGKVYSGVWESTPGIFKVKKGERFEFCFVLEGEMELTDDGGETKRYVAGDAFVMKPGFTGTWKTIRTLRKAYVTVD